MRVLYLAPLLPATSGNGGRKAIFNHVMDLLSSNIKFEAIFVDVEGTGDDLPVFPRDFPRKVFGRQLPKAGQGLSGKMIGIVQALLGKLPRSIAVVASVPARRAIAKTLSDPSLDLIIVDHLNAYGLVRGLARTARLMYVAHNVEAEVLRHQIEEMKGMSVTKVLRTIDHSKMVRVERELLKDSDRIVLIGSGDLMLEAIQEHLPKVYIWPELPDEKEQKWQYQGSRKLLFVGSPGYFPNRDAIEWLINILMPKIYELDSTITLHLVGSDVKAFAMATLPPNIRFEGFVSDVRLKELHAEADLFICPVILGAGIKIKVLEAASFGMPVLATAESLKGIDFLLDTAFEFSRTVPGIARQIIELLNNEFELVTAGSRGLENLREARIKRGALVDC
jgi:glycosyltransferase involved in cell wall biosynthesis